MYRYINKSSLIVYKRKNCYIYCNKYIYSYFTDITCKFPIQIVTNNVEDN